VPASEDEAVVRSPTNMAAAKTAAVHFNKMTSLDQPACGHVRWGRSASQSTASHASAVRIGRKKSREYKSTGLTERFRVFKSSRLCIGSRVELTPIHTDASRCPVWSGRGLGGVESATVALYISTNCRRRCRSQADTGVPCWTAAGNSASLEL